MTKDSMLRFNKASTSLSDSHRAIVAHTRSLVAVPEAGSHDIFIKKVPTIDLGASDVQYPEWKLSVWGRVRSALKPHAL